MFIRNAVKPTRQASEANSYHCSSVVFELTLPVSVGLVNMIMVLESSCHTILQMSFSVPRVGPRTYTHT